MDTENLPPRRSTRLRSGTTASSASTNNPSSYEGLKSQNVSPLRISKSNSRSKTLASMAEDTTLRDISPGSSRRNSPSTFQIKEKVAALQTAVNKSPPASPQLGMVKSDSAGSVRSFWQTAAANGGTPEGGHKRQQSKSEGQVKTTIRSSIVKNNIFLTNDLREREGSPKLTMSPSQHRLSAQLGEVQQQPPQQQPTSTAVNAFTSRIPAPVEASQSPRKEIRPQNTNTSEVTPKASCLHSTRIKGPRENVGEDSDSPSPFGSRRERRKTVTFDQAPQVLEFDRRSSHGTTASDRSSAVYDESSEARQHSESNSDSETYEESASRPLPSIPPRPLPQVPPHDSEDERPSSKESNDSEYEDMEERIRRMMQRVELRDQEKKSDPSDQDDIFSLYTTTNEMEDDEPSSQGESVFDSQGTGSTGMTSQLESQDEELERQFALQKQANDLLKAVKTRPFSALGQLPDLGFGDDDDDEGFGSGLGLREYCSPDPESQAKQEPPTSPAPSVNTQVNSLFVAPKPTTVEKDIKSPSPQETESLTPPVTPPLGSSDLPDPETPQNQILPPLDTLPSTPPTSPHKPSLPSEDEVPSPVIPEREATIRSRGTKLRIRPSLSRQEAESIVARRRKSELPPVPTLNGIREQSIDPEVKVKVEEDDLSEFGGKLGKVEVGPLLKIDSLGFENDAETSGFGELAVEEMERVIEAQKRGYMMRQHSKVVHASSGNEHLRAAKVQERMASSISVDWGAKRAPQNPVRKPLPQPGARKPSKELPKSNIPAPAQKNGDSRGASKESAQAMAPPPLARKNTSGEYGRLFIKVVKLKELELPLPKDEPMYFSCTLDNGLHCVTTPFKLLQTEAKIDQEFELIATDKLEFMLTLQARINLPPAPTKTKGTLGKGAFQRIFGSPKKKPATPIPQKDPYHGLSGIIGRDGSFSRSYVALKTYENAAYGRQFTTDIACLNEWAVEPGARGREMQKMRKRPYLIGKIECQLLFVPCMNPNEELPKSMSGAIREMKNAEWFNQLLWEGYLSQQGGDCQHWRRRYFKLVGSSLVGYHESTRARRATINLAKSTRVVDDRESLIETPPVKGRGQRRKSGFHNEEAEGYMYLEEGFRIWFGNGEVIDFRADTREEKREWVNVLQGVVGKVPVRKEWAEAVLQRERAMKQ